MSCICISSISRAEHLTLTWYRGLGELGNAERTSIGRQKFPLTYRCLTSQQMVIQRDGGLYFLSLVRREGNNQMMKAEVNLGYPKPLAFKYMAAVGGIVPALFPQGRTNSLVKIGWVCNHVEMYLHQCRSFSVLVALAHSNPTWKHG